MYFLLFIFLFEVFLPDISNLQPSVERKLKKKINKQKNSKPLKLADQKADPYLQKVRKRPGFFAGGVL